MAGPVTSAEASESALMSIPLYFACTQMAWLPSSWMSLRVVPVRGCRITLAVPRSFDLAVASESAAVPSRPADSVTSGR